MSTRDPIDRLEAWFADTSEDVRATDVLKDVFMVTGRLPQRRGPVAILRGRLQDWASAPSTVHARRLAVATVLVLLAIVAAWAVIGSTRPPLPPPFASEGFIPITREDGRAALIDARGAELTITPPDTVDHAVVVSPDGRWIATVHRRARSAENEPLTLAIAPVDRPMERRVVEGVQPYPPGELSWSPQGDAVVVVTVTSVVGPERLPDERTLTILRLATGERVELPVSDLTPTVPVWSPDGRWIAFYSWVNGWKTVRVVRSDGSEVRILADVIVGFQPEGLSWSPDSRSLAYVSSGGPRSADGIDPVDVFTVDIANPVPVNRTRTPDEQERGPVWSRDGRRVAFNAGPRTAILDLATGAISYPTTPDRQDLAFGWSEDGEWLAVLRTSDGREGSPNDLWLYSVTGSEPPRRLASGVARSGVGGVLQWQANPEP